MIVRVVDIYAVIDHHCLNFIISISTLQTMGILYEGYSRNTSYVLNQITMLYNYHWADTSTHGILVHEGIIRPIVNVSYLLIQTNENTEETIKNGKTRETGNMQYTRRRK